MSQNFSAYQPKSGTYTSDGNANTVTVGFNPAMIIVINTTDGDTMGLWFEGMAAASVQKNVAGTHTFATTNGISVSNGVITFGTDATLNENTKVFRYFAC